MDAEFWGTLIGAAVGAAFAVHKGISIFVDKVVAYTAAQTTVNEIKKKVETIEEDLKKVKDATVPKSATDDRGPKL